MSKDRIAFLAAWPALQRVEEMPRISALDKLALSVGHGRIFDIICIIVSERVHYIYNIQHNFIPWLNYQF